MHKVLIKMAVTINLFDSAASEMVFCRVSLVKAPLLMDVLLLLALSAPPPPAAAAASAPLGTKSC